MSPQQMDGPQQELMQSESENRLLRHRLTTTRDQATGIEASLAEVAQLTELFTHQVMSQSEQIETLYDEVTVQSCLMLLADSLPCCQRHVALMLRHACCASHDYTLGSY